LTVSSITPGWATYLRVSDEDKQTPSRSFAMQRQRIDEHLVTESNLPIHHEYKDLLSGTKANRKDYQQMLADAKAGKFSHLGLYRADRFGRNTIEGLQAATQLISLGVKIRIASMPSLRPEEPDGFFMFLIQMGMAQREVDVMAQRVADGIEAKLRSGGWANKAPEGYVNKERQVSSGKYERWIEADPQYFKPLQEAWQLLLTDRYTLDEICEELHKAGYTRSTGLPWVWVDPKSGRRKTAKARLQKFFHNPFYAGWIVSKHYNIKMGDVRGNWEPVITSEQFQKGRAVLRKHGHKKSRLKRKYYLLRNLLYVDVAERQYKMYGSTPSGRAQSYSYYITHSKPQGKAIRLKTEVVDTQIPAWLQGIAIDAGLIPQIRKTYQTQIKNLAGGDKESQRDHLNKKLKALRDEEARLGRLLITEKISEATYDQLRLEWQEKVVNIQLKLEELAFDASLYLDDLEIALVLLSQVSILFARLDEKQKNTLLQILLKRIIINSDGEIVDFELHSPFNYLYSLAIDNKDISPTSDNFIDMLDFSNRAGVEAIFQQ
jgi:DNA invertase Pin-like site-specific DNA recombinase